MPLGSPYTHDVCHTVMASQAHLYNKQDYGFN